MGGCPKWWNAVQHFLLPGLIISLIFLAMGQHVIGAILLALNVGFLTWVLYHRFGLLASITVKRGVSFNLRNMEENLHGRLYQIRCLNNLLTLINDYKKGPRIVEKGGVRVLFRSFHLYSDNEKDSNGDRKGNLEITNLILQVLFDLLCTSPKDGSKNILKAWPIKDIANYIDELNSNDLDMNEKDRNQMILLVLKIVQQLSEHTTQSERDTVSWNSILMKSVLNCMKERLRDLEEGESIQQWGTCALYNMQHGVNSSKLTFSKYGGFNVVLDAVRRYRSAVKVNELAAILMVECVFESVANDSTELKFMPEPFAEALSSGVMSALHDMEKEFPENGSIHNCHRLLKNQYSKPRKMEVEIDHVEFVEMN
jgi:hypothetical protein